MTDPTALRCVEGTEVSPVHSLDHTQSQTWSCSWVPSCMQTHAHTWWRPSPCLSSLVPKQHPDSRKWTPNKTAACRSMRLLPQVN